MSIPIGVYLIFALCMIGCSYTCWMIGICVGAEEAIDVLVAQGKLQIVEQEEDADGSD